MISQKLIILLGIICGILLTFLLRLLFGNVTTKDLSSQTDTIYYGDSSGKNNSIVFNTKIIHLRGNSTTSQILATPSKAPTTINLTPLTQSCKFNFKVYVYDLPSDLLALKISEEARRNKTYHICQKCILEQFSLEYIMNDFFTKFCGRTLDPEEADFFYLPLVRDAEYRWAMQQGGIRQRAPSRAEEAILSMLEKNNSDHWVDTFKVTDKYWKRYNGADHIIVMPAPVTNFRHQSSQRGFFHYMIQLYSPIFFALEYSKNFIEEYPICTKLKNIIAPYPTTDPDLFNGKLHSFSIERNALLYYAGGLHGDCIETRKAMFQIMKNSTRLNNVIPKVKSIQAEREHGFLAATFCPIPVGDSPSSKRMYDVLNFGCIPVVLSDDLVWGFSDQTGGPLNHNEFSIQIPQSVIQYTAERSLKVYAHRKEEFGKLPSGILIYDLLFRAVAQKITYENGQYINPLVHILRRVPQSDIDFLKKNGVKAASFYRYYSMNSNMKRIPTSGHDFPDGGAFDMIGTILSTRKMNGISNISQLCLAELEGPHKYINRFHCEKDSLEALSFR